MIKNWLNTTQDLSCISVSELSRSVVDTVRRCSSARVLQILQSLGQHLTRRPPHAHRVPAEQSLLIVDQLPPETSVGSDEGSLLQNLLKSLT